MKANGILGDLNPSVHPDLAWPELVEGSRDEWRETSLTRVFMVNYPNGDPEGNPIDLSKEMDA